MKLTRISAPSVLALSIDDVLAHLHLPPDASDTDDIERIMAGVIAELDGPDGKLGRCLISQSWSGWLDGFPCGAVKLPLPPLLQLLCVKYLDSDNAWQTLDPAKYRLVLGGSARSEIWPAQGESWPSALYAPASVEIRFRCGFGSNPADIPGDLVNAMLEMVGQRYVLRDGTFGGVDRLIPFGEEPGLRAIQRYRVYF